MRIVRRTLPGQRDPEGRLGDAQQIIDAATGLLTGKTAVKTQSAATIDVSQGTRTTALALGGMALVAVALVVFRPRRGGHKRRRSRRRR